MRRKSFSEFFYILYAYIIFLFILFLLFFCLFVCVKKMFKKTVRADRTGPRPAQPAQAAPPPFPSSGQSPERSRAAAVLTDPAARARHHQAALLATRRAIDLAPDSLKLAHFRALLLYEAASDNRAYEEVIAECERGLRIDDPSDPEPHSLRLPTPDPDQLRAELRNRASALLRPARHRASSPPAGRVPNAPPPSTHPHTRLSRLGAQSTMEGHGRGRRASSG